MCYVIIHGARFTGARADKDGDREPESDRGGGTDRRYDDDSGDGDRKFASRECMHIYLGWQDVGVWGCELRVVMESRKNLGKFIGIM